MVLALLTDGYLDGIVVLALSACYPKATATRTCLQPHHAVRLVRVDYIRFEYTSEVQHAMWHFVGFEILTASVRLSNPPITRLCEDGPGDDGLHVRYVWPFFFSVSIPAKG
jgi:hypothetical protein